MNESFMQHMGRWFFNRKGYFWYSREQKRKQPRNRISHKSGFPGAGLDDAQP